jgi:hypothetical protein
MDKYRLSFVFLAPVASVLFFASCGEGEPVDLADRGSQYREIEQAVDNLVNEDIGVIKQCEIGIDGSLPPNNCPQVPEPQAPPENSSSSKGGGLPPSTGGSSSSKDDGGGSVGLTCTAPPSSGKVGVKISPAPTVRCNGATVTPTSWVPANLTPTAAGESDVIAKYACNSETEKKCGVIIVTDNTNNNSSSSGGGGACVDPPGQIVPSNPLDLCIKKDGKCYKCNPDRGATGDNSCSSSWLWDGKQASEAYWFIVVTCY